MISVVSPVGIFLLIIFAVVASFLLGWIVGHLVYASRRYRVLHTSELAVPMRPAPRNLFEYDEAATMPTPQTTSYPTYSDASDLKIIEGIGPKIEEVLKRAGITDWTMLASSSVGTLRSVLAGAGPQFQLHEPASWPEQAAYARDGKWAELHEFQEFLVGGR